MILFWQHAGKSLAAEVKYADAPRLTPSMKSALGDLELDHLWVLYPGDRRYPLAENVTVLPLAQLGNGWPDPGHPMGDLPPGCGAGSALAGS